LLPRLVVIFGFIFAVPLFYLQFHLPWSTVMVVVLMGLITVRLVVAGKIGKIPDAADSLYFLGFVITLLSLFVAFKTLSANALDQNRPDAAVKELFGIIGSGLSTTIAGLMMRELVYLAGARSPQIDIGEVTQEEIKQVISSLNSALQLGKEAVEISSVAAQSADRYRASFDSYSSMLDEYSQSLKSFEDHVIHPMDAVSDELTSTLAEISTHLSSTNKSLSSTTAQLGDTNSAFSDLKTHLDSLNNQIPHQFGEMSSAVNRTTNQLQELEIQYKTLTSAMHQDFSGLEKIAQSLPQVSASVTSLQQGLADISTHLNSANKGLSSTTAQLGDTSSTFSDLKTQLDSLNNQIPDQFGEMSSAVNSTTTQLQELETQYKTLTSAMHQDFSGLEKIAQSLPQVSASVSGLQQGFAGLQKAINDLESLKSSVDSFSTTLPGSLGIFQASTDQMSHKMDNLAHHYSDLIATLKKDHDNLRTIADNLPSENVWKPLTYLSDIMPGVSSHLRQSSQKLEESSFRLDTASQVFSDSQVILNSMMNSIKASSIAQPRAAAPQRPQPAPPRTLANHPAAKVNGTYKAPKPAEKTPEPVDNFTLPASEEIIVPGKSQGMKGLFSRLLGRR
jgi:uncharacterized phage infection (PIP) family protein YhgE